MKLKKLLGVLLLTMCTSCFISCDSSKDGNDEIDLATSLKQTTWQGIYYVGNVPEASVGLVFYTEKGGYCDWNFDGRMPYNDYFDYELDKKLLVIRGSMVGGNWMITSKNKKKMILEKGTGANLSIKAIMVLEREN